MAMICRQLKIVPDYISITVLSKGLLENLCLATLQNSRPCKIAVKSCRVECSLAESSSRQRPWLRAARFLENKGPPVVLFWGHARRQQDLHNSLMVANISINYISAESLPPYPALKILSQTSRHQNKARSKEF